LADLLRTRARGHPFFCLELAQALLDERLVEVVDGTARLLRDSAPEALKLPDTLRAAVKRRLDGHALSAPYQFKPGSRDGLRAAIQAASPGSSQNGNAFGSASCEQRSSVERRRAMLPGSSTTCSRTGSFSTSSTTCAISRCAPALGPQFLFDSVMKWQSFTLPG